MIFKLDFFNKIYFGNDWEKKTLYLNLQQFLNVQMPDSGIFHSTSFVIKWVLKLWKGVGTMVRK